MLQARLAGSLRAGKVLKVYVDLGAATQSPREATRLRGLYYVGIDTREWVLLLGDTAEAINAWIGRDECE